MHCRADSDIRLSHLQWRGCSGLRDKRGASASAKQQRPRRNDRIAAVVVLAD
jgi:hypothetical protein